MNNEIEKLAEELKSSLDVMIRDNEDLNDASWNYQAGVLITGNRAKLILDVISAYQKATEAQKQPAMGDSEQAKELYIKTECSKYTTVDKVIARHAFDFGFKACQQLTTHALQHPKPAMSLDECKQAIADKYNCKDWFDVMIQFSTTIPSPSRLWEEVAELYANQFREDQKWEPTRISIDDVKAGDKILLTPKNEDFTVVIDKITDRVLHYHVIGREEILSVSRQAFEKDSNLFLIPLPKTT